MRDAEPSGSPAAGKKRAVPEPITDYKAPPRAKLDYNDGIKNHIASGKPEDRKGKKAAYYGYRLCIKASAETPEEGEAMADKIGCDVLVGDSIEYLDAKEGKPACYYGKFWTQLALDTMKAAAGKHLGGKLALTGGWWEVKERKWELYAADGVKVRGPTLYPRANCSLHFSISTHVPDMTASYDSIAQG